MEKDGRMNWLDETYNRQVIWELYADLLDYFPTQDFTALAVAKQTHRDKKLINKSLHRLIQHGAVLCTGKDHWGIKKYRLNPDFNT